MDVHTQKRVWSGSVSGALISQAATAYQADPTNPERLKDYAVMLYSDQVRLRLSQLHRARFAALAEPIREFVTARVAQAPDQRIEFTREEVELIEPMLRYLLWFTTQTDLGFDVTWRQQQRQLILKAVSQIRNYSRVTPLFPPEAHTPWLLEMTAVEALLLPLPGLPSEPKGKEDVPSILGQVETRVGHVRDVNQRARLCRQLAVNWRRLHKPRRAQWWFSQAATLPGVARGVRAKTWWARWAPLAWL
ncbi:MAG: hypothetical protein ACOC4E_02160 [Patescibacteria group bacterium]